jgi:hypothetical protein
MYYILVYTKGAIVACGVWFELGVKLVREKSER